jgi:hypothetical protein
MADLFDKESLEIICPKCKKKIKQPVAWFQTKQNALPSFASPNQYSWIQKRDR